MKYIIFNLPNGMGTPTVRIFDEITSHNEVRAEVQSGKPGLQVESAGLIRLDDDGEFSVVNGSTTLGLRYSAEQTMADRDLLTKFFQFRA